MSLHITTMSQKNMPFPDPSRENERGKFSPGPTTFGGPTVAQKYKVHQNVPLQKAKLKHFSPDGPCENAFPGPRYVSRHLAPSMNCLL